MRKRQNEVGILLVTIERPVPSVDQVNRISFRCLFQLIFPFVCLGLVSVTDDEMQRLRLAFKRGCGVSGFMPQTVFAREVVGDGVPSKVAEVRKSIAL